MLLTFALLFALHWQNVILEKKMDGLDVLVVDMENTGEGDLIFQFLQCLEKFFEFNPAEDAYSRVGYGCAMELADPKADGYFYQFSSKNQTILCPLNLGNGNLDNALAGARQKVKDYRMNASLITVVLTGNYLIETALSEDNKKIFHDEPNMLLVITFTDNVNKGDIARATGREDRIIHFVDCQETFKENFRQVLCQPASLNPVEIMGNCSNDTNNDFEQRKILRKPQVQRAETVCPKKYWQIRIENCSTENNEVSTILPTTAIIEQQGIAYLPVINTIGIGIIIAAIIAIVWIVYRHYCKKSKKKQKWFDSLHCSTLHLEESVSTIKSMEKLPIKSLIGKKSHYGQNKKLTKHSANTLAKKSSNKKHKSAPKF